MKHIFAILIFIPITTFFLMSTFFEACWRSLHAFHYETLENLVIPIPDQYHQVVSEHPNALLFTKILVQFFGSFWSWFQRLKDVNSYKF